LDRSHRSLVASGIVIAIGIVLLAVPPDGSELNVFLREDVILDPGIGTMSNIDLPRGRYQLWIPDVNRTTRDWGHFEFSIEDLNDRIPVEASDGSVVRDIDGVPHELYGSFTVRDSGMYFYDTSTSRREGGEEAFELVFTRSSAFGDRPLLWPGVVLIGAGALIIVGLVLRRFMRECRDPMAGRRGG
jgi:hypothetical protein